jgi:hypothetical protein
LKLPNTFWIHNLPKDNQKTNLPAMSERERKRARHDLLNKHHSKFHYSKVAGAKVSDFKITWSAASLNSTKVTISNTNELSYPQLCRSANAHVTGSDSNQICQICDLLKVPKSSYLITQNYQ